MQDTPLPVCPGRQSVSGYIDLCTSEHAVLLHEVTLHLCVFVYVCMGESMQHPELLCCNAAHFCPSRGCHRPPPGHSSKVAGGQSSPSAYPEAARLNLQTPNLSAGKAKRRRRGPQRSITVLQLHDNSNPPASRHDIQLVYWHNQLINTRSSTTFSINKCHDYFEWNFEILFILYLSGFMSWSYSLHVHFVVLVFPSNPKISCLCLFFVPSQIPPVFSVLIQQLLTP